MGVLTKVFIVLVAVLSVLLGTLTVTFVANTENYRQQLENALTYKAAAEETARLRQNELSAAQSNDSERIALLKGQAENLITQLNQLTQELAESKARAQNESAKLSKFEADWSRLTAANQQHAQITKELQSELRERREQMVDQQTRTIQLADRNNELEGQLAALTRQVRRVHEKMTNLQEENTQLTGKLAQLPPQWQARLLSEQTVAAPFVPETPIRGQITQIEQHEGESFVQIDVGSNDGVQSNMKFLVHRGSQFLGTLVITNVDTQNSAGRIELLQGTVAVGDAVLTGGY